MSEWLPDARQCSYSLCGLTIDVQCEGRESRDEIERVFRPLSFTQAYRGTECLRVELTCVDSDVPADIPQTGQEPVTCYDLQIFETGDGVCLTDGWSAFRSCRDAGKGIITFHRSFREKDPLSKQNFFLVGLSHLLAPLGFYDLHGAAVTWGDACCLLLGESGSGKSSTALSLVRLGWDYTSDDAVLLRSLPNRIEALAFRKKFFVYPAVGRCHPEIREHLEPAPGGDVAKQFLDVDLVYPGRFRPNCAPTVLIFCSIIPRSESILEPLDQTSALIRLLKQSASVFFSRAFAEAHMEVLKRLIYQTKSYQLFAGRDLCEQPDKITNILSKVRELQQPTVG
jgi:hypothetical protein